MLTQSGAVPADLIELGRITGAYGVHGWVKIEPYAAQSAVLLGVRQWWLGREADVAGGGAAQAPRPVRVLRSRPQGSSIVAHLEGVDDRTVAEALKSQRVWVPRSTFPAPDDDEYYWVDLIGCAVWGVDEAGGPVMLGSVVQVADNGAHAVLEVQRLSEAGAPAVDAKGRPVTMLVPFVEAHVGSVDLAERRIDTDWPADF
ncbi:ribosome maturation factor RimM [Verticiella sediminum]|uniref:Ribosome maturation factor RimM n=1 Tax=Verticiella sediminum TaxID=1247510 RepID=A0A556ABG1_9BURK|nr:ribosome maturation factor RimM [Verticiella sediminum]TSH90213.1 ribosome maturation factor RimM [Verticiella sediminum]